MTSFRGHVLVTGGEKKREEKTQDGKIYIYIWIDRFKREFGIKLSLKLMVGRDNGCLDSRLSYIVYCTSKLRVIEI